MSKPMTQAMVESGLVDAECVSQLLQWKMLTEDEMENWAHRQMHSPKAVEELIHTVLDGPETVEVRDTDPDVIWQFLKTKVRGKLHVPNPEQEGKTLGFAVEYSKTTLGEYVIPWTSESIRDLIVDPETYLKPLKEPRVYFADVRDLFYDDYRAFMVCVPLEK